MKKFYGKHPRMYTGPVGETGIYKASPFAPLAVTGFHNKEGWKTASNGFPEIKKKDRRTNSMDEFRLRRVINAEESLMKIS